MANVLWSIIYFIYLRFIYVGSPFEIEYLM